MDTFPRMVNPAVKGLPRGGGSILSWPAASPSLSPQDREWLRLVAIQRQHPGLLSPVQMHHLREHGLNLHTPFDSVLLRPTPWERVKLQAHNTFVTLPKTILQGLRGDANFSFSDFLHVAKIPYYVGGLVLAFGFSPSARVQQGIGVASYLAGHALVGRGIDWLIRKRHGVDMSLLVRTPNGDINSVFGSADFPRVDVLEPQDREVIRQKMGIPQYVAYPDAEINLGIRQVISASRVYKALLGTLMAAIGAGYFARAEAWKRILGQNTLGYIWKPWLKGPVVEKISKTITVFSAMVGEAVKDRFLGGPYEKNPWIRRTVWGSLAAMAAVAFSGIWWLRPKNLQYEPSGLSPLIPSTPTRAVNPGDKREKPHFYGVPAFTSRNSTALPIDGSFVGLNGSVQGAGL